MFKNHCIRCLFVALFASYAQAESFLSRDNIDEMLEHLGGSNDSIDETKSVDWGVLPGPFSSPELGVGIGAAAVGLYRIDEDDVISQSSVISLTGFVSSTGAFGLDIDNYNFFSEDKWRLFIHAQANNTPTYYWGIGDSLARDDRNKEEYTERSVALNPKGLMKVADSTYVGLGWDLSLMKASDLDKDNDSLLIKEHAGSSVTSSGIGSYLLYDSRDFVSNPSKGYFASAELTYFLPELASDQRFNRLITQFSYYHSINDKNIIAFDAYGQFMGGDVPWNELALLGSDKRMRGYYEGQYRDRNMLTTQIEYRRKFDWRHGMALWIGAGTLSHRTQDIGSKRWLPNAGIGYRFEFKPKMNIRLDYGIGEKSSGFYFQIGEAF